MDWFVQREPPPAVLVVCRSCVDLALGSVLGLVPLVPLMPLSASACRAGKPIWGQVLQSHIIGMQDTNIIRPESPFAVIFHSPHLIDALGTNQ
jgi:hypothetical protein